MALHLTLQRSICTNSERDGAFVWVHFSSLQVVQLWTARFVNSLPYA